jgi:hypothetical protein
VGTAFTQTFVMCVKTDFVNIVTYRNRTQRFSRVNLHDRLLVSKCVLVNLQNIENRNRNFIVAVSHLRSKLSSALLARRFCAMQNNAGVTVVMIANQVLHSLRFFIHQCQGAALVTAADSVAAWRFQTPGSAL